MRFPLVPPLGSQCASRSNSKQFFLQNWQLEYLCKPCIEFAVLRHPLTETFTFIKLNLPLSTPSPFQHSLAHKLFVCVHCFQTHCTEYPSANADRKMTLQSHSANPCLVARLATQHAFDKWQHAGRGQLQHQPKAVQNVHSLIAWQLNSD